MADARAVYMASIEVPAEQIHKSSYDIQSFCKSAWMGKVIFWNEYF